ncbi:VanZ family protein [Oceanirhabdus sp. W0125-5]|uniref:VanZ family protein n=1 Tax=Oceanirhabdus sp. W0125-5 TaxID=2999116 RepID=UPI0022F2CE08|nr:VanZ family protein [Oceanirhabdus sp. W0125-5]WBW96197.1 VanZ family protein [Oceanirhabdus sp. W0125-5]
MKKKRAIRWGLVIGWMIVIFMFSSDVAETSNEKSNFIVEIIDAVGVDVENVFKGNIEFLIRKLAHFTEYGILSVLIYRAVTFEYLIKGVKVFTKKHYTKCFTISILITFMYACSDEFHQLFVPGRDGSIRDVLIDTSGGIFILLLIIATPFIKNVIRGRIKR